MPDAFSHAAHWAAQQCGRATVFILAVAIIIAWAASGPLFHYSDTWQLIINTGTTIITFLMVFLIQNTQNRDTAAIQLKLDELIRANQNARNLMLCLEDLSEEDLQKVKKSFAALAPSEGVAAKVQQAAQDLAEAGDSIEQVTSRLESMPPPSIPELEGAQHG
ncbi:MAG TPA: low affinity iron permease family protein [Acidobacteriaceae bacterium]